MRPLSSRVLTKATRVRKPENGFAEGEQGQVSSTATCDGGRATDLSPHQQDETVSVPLETINEITFVARLGAATRVRAEQKRARGEHVLIARGDVEEKQVDDEGRVRRCDIRLSSVSGRKLVSGEMKRPEVPEGRDPRNESLRADARRKAIARGLPYYFTCNMAEVVLYATPSRPGEFDREETSFHLAPIKHSGETEAYQVQIESSWSAFLDDLEGRLSSVDSSRPVVSNSDLMLLRKAIYAVADEAIDRVAARVVADASVAGDARTRTRELFGFPVDLKPEFPAQLRDELLQILRLSAFVVAQKLILQRVLQETGPKKATPFELDPVRVDANSRDPNYVRMVFDAAFAQARLRSGDYQTAFDADPMPELLFVPPRAAEEVSECRAGTVWSNLVSDVNSVAWASISRNLIGFLYEVIVEPRFRHELGQYYTPEDVVDLLVSFAVLTPSDTVLDPASGGGSFLRSAYQRKRDLGANHEATLEDVWGFEITGFAAELSTITLATSDTHEPAAYPRVILRDFFELAPGMNTDLAIPGLSERVRIPAEYDAVVGNPPYISYRHQKNQAKVVGALARLPSNVDLPRFSGKSDAFVWFFAHSTQFLREGGRLSFVVSSALLFADYGVPLIAFLGRHYKIVAVVDSAVERWFPDADTNTVMLMLERCSNEELRAANPIRFVRLRRKLAQLLPPSTDLERRSSLEEFVSDIVGAHAGTGDPRMMVNVVEQGAHGGLAFGEAEDAMNEEGDL